MVWQKASRRDILPSSQPVLPGDENPPRFKHGSPDVVTAGNEDYYNNLVDQLGFGTIVTLAADSSNLVDALTDSMTQITEARIENAIGSVYNDTLIGNGLDNRLEGLAGNDTYYVQDSGDVVVEANLGGADLVVSSGSYALSANVENLTLSGTANIDATGNALNNQLVGNSGANVISGEPVPTGCSVTAATTPTSSITQAIR
ncbi:hypothetical protein [Pseudomonas laurylsulfatiphila]|uniref:hypothetical protein n=1 Tax=Pseudomonas laurylsulfatiphila TaxID=2011015 RepID=UPI003D1FF7E6